MADDTLLTRSNGEKIDGSWFNSIKNFFLGSILPRNASGVVESEAGNLGSATYRWKKMRATVGHLFLGQIKKKFDYNGAVTIEQGWMLCDGRQITQANYDTEHGAGSWAAYIGSTPLNNKYLPDMSEASGVYESYSSTTPTSSGASPIPLVGDNTIDMLHTHPEATSDNAVEALVFGGAGVDNRQPLAAHTHTITLDQDLANNENCLPESLRVKFYMRIVA